MPSTEVTTTIRAAGLYFETSLAVCPVSVNATISFALISIAISTAEDATASATGIGFGMALRRAWNIAL